MDETSAHEEWIIKALGRPKEEDIPGDAGFVFPEGTVTQAQQPHADQAYELRQELHSLGLKTVVDTGALRWRYLGNELNLESSGKLTNKQKSLLASFIRKYSPEIVNIDITKRGQVLRTTELVNPSSSEIIRYLEYK